MTISDKKETEKFSKDDKSDNLPDSDFSKDYFAEFYVLKRKLNHLKAHPSKVSLLFQMHPSQNMIRKLGRLKISIAL